MNAEPRHSAAASGRHRHPILSHLEHKLAAGLLVVVPLGITLFILRFLFRLADGLLAPYIARAGSFLGQRSYLPGLGIIAGVVLIYFAGLLATNVLGHRFIGRWDRLLSRIPLVKSIYTAAKQLVEVFARKNGAGFRQAAYVEFPLDGVFALAFISNESVSATGKRYYSCFVPTAPNPTSGFVLILEENQVYPAGISIEEAMKIIVSGGFVAPDLLREAKLQ